MTAGVRHEQVDCGGVKLHCAVAGETGRPLMLFLHGFPEFWAAWRVPMEQFAARGWLAVAPDLRGYNLSDKPAGVDAYKVKHLVNDVLALAAHYARGKFVLVAHDWGGAGAGFAFGALSGASGGFAGAADPDSAADGGVRTGGITSTLGAPRCVASSPYHGGG